MNGSSAMKKYLLLVLVVLFTGIIFAHEEVDVEQAKALIDAKTSCDKLSNEQLELVGEYYMEKMHPGEAHEMMNDMMEETMGAEGEESMHIQMARALYCKDKEAVASIMNNDAAGTMKMLAGSGMGKSFRGGRMMMGGWWGVGSFLSTLLGIGLVLIVWLFVIKLWKEVFRKK